MMDIEEVQFNLSLVIRDVLKMLSYDASKKKLNFTSDIRFPGTEDLTVMGDPGRVRQILMNLLSNSMKFTNEGYVQLKVVVEKEEDEAITIYFVVKDSGIGISAQDQVKLFQPFTQADSSTARKYGGTGLGLTICRNLVTLMGGSIGLSSTLGHGTKAFFTIPFKKPHGDDGEGTEDGSVYREVDSLPERLQSDVSISCQSSDSFGTSPDSPYNAPLTGEKKDGVGKSLLKKISRSSMISLDSNNESVSPEERMKQHVLVVEDSEYRVSPDYRIES